MTAPKIQKSPYQQGNLIKKFSLRFAIVFGLMLIALCTFWFIIHEVVWEKEDNVDKEVLNFLSNNIHPRLTGLMQAITFLASSKFLIGAYAILIIWYFFVQKR